MPLPLFTFVYHRTARRDNGVNNSERSGPNTLRYDKYTQSNGRTETNSKSVTPRSQKKDSNAPKNKGMQLMDGMIRQRRY